MSFENKGSMPCTVMVSREPDRSGNWTCDGTADDVQIQAAIDYINSLGGGKVFLGRGTYDFTAVVDIYSDTTIQGAGWDTILQPSVNTVVFQNANIPATPADAIVDRGIVVRDLAIDGNEQIEEMIDFASVGDSQIIKVYIYDVGYTDGEDAIDIDACENVIISECLFKNIGGSAIHISDCHRTWAVYKGCDYCKVVNSHAENCGKDRTIGAFNTYTRAAAIGGGQHNSFTNCTAYDCYYGFSDANDLQPSYTEFNGCRVESSTNDGIVLSNLEGHARIIGGDVINAAGDGIYVNSPKNHILGTHVTLSGDHGIRNISDWNIIEGCTIKNSDLSAVYLSNATYNSIIGNHLIDDQGSQTQDYGVQEAGSSDYNKIFNNTFTGNVGGAAVIVGLNTRLPSKPYQFVKELNGTYSTSSPTGISVTAATHAAILQGDIPSEARRVMRIRVSAVALGAPVNAGGQMHLEITFNAGTGNAAYNTAAKSWVQTNHDSQEADYVANDVVTWVIDHGDQAELANLAPFDSFELILTHEAAADPDGATNAVFRSILLEYV